ncbi:trans-L-3-hydroxyproline dehydratase [Nematostella vectensis]|nr:trans-L-3-hydroxyproline dehydratase [Nematostella vectensis]
MAELSDLEDGGVHSLEEGIQIRTVEMHTGGEPLRIITSGYPEIKGETILQKRRFVRDNLDYLRKMLMFEPRGHADMYGALLVEPDAENADMAVLFLHNEGYSTMCGHAIIALGRYAVDTGVVAVDTDSSSYGEVPVFIQCPCGVVKAFVELCEGKSGKVRFVSVPAFAFAIDLVVETDKYGPVKLDIGYGGAFYAIVSGDKLGLDVKTCKVRDAIDAAAVISRAVKNQVKLTHPDSPELAFLYGVIITDSKDRYSDDPDDCTKNITVFADNQVDRCPTGSGVTARIAVQYAKQLIGLNQLRVFEGVSGSKFGGRVLKETKCGEFDAVHVEVAGHAFYTGSCSFRVEKDDDLKYGFLLK